MVLEWLLIEKYSGSHDSGGFFYRLGQASIQFLDDPHPWRKIIVGLERPACDMN